MINFISLKHKLPKEDHYNLNRVFSFCVPDRCSDAKTVKVAKIKRGTLPKDVSIFTEELKVRKGLSFDVKFMKPEETSNNRKWSLYMRKYIIQRTPSEFSSPEPLGPLSRRRLGTRTKGLWRHRMPEVLECSIPFLFMCVAFK